GRVERRAGGEQQSSVPGLQMDDLGIERVRDRGADWAACLEGRSKHKVVDEQLGAAVEELGEALSAVLGLEPVVLLDWDPGQLAPLPGQLVAAACELLLLLQQLVAFRLPLLPACQSCALSSICHLLFGFPGPAYDPPPRPLAGGACPGPVRLPDAPSRFKWERILCQ